MYRENLSHLIPGHSRVHAVLTSTLAGKSRFSEIQLQSGEGKCELTNISLHWQVAFVMTIDTVPYTPKHKCIPE